MLPVPRIEIGTLRLSYRRKYSLHRRSCLNGSQSRRIRNRTYRNLYRLILPLWPAPRRKRSLRKSRPSIPLRRTSTPSSIYLLSWPPFLTSRFLKTKRSNYYFKYFRSRHGNKNLNYNYGNNIGGFHLCGCGRNGSPRTWSCSYGRRCRNHMYIPVK